MAVETIVVRTSDVAELTVVGTWVVEVVVDDPAENFLSTARTSSITNPASEYPASRDKPPGGVRRSPLPENPRITVVV